MTDEDGGQPAGGECFAKGCDEDPIGTQMVSDGSVEYGIQPLCDIHAKHRVEFIDKYDDGGGR